MPFDLNKIPRFVRSRLINFNGWDEEQPPLREPELEERLATWLKTASKRDIIDAYLHYEGIIGYVDTIIELFDAVDEAEVKQLPDYSPLSKQEITSPDVDLDHIINNSKSVGTIDG